MKFKKKIGIIGGMGAAASARFYNILVDKIHLEGKLAFGANLYLWLKKHKDRYNISTYTPELLSKYLILDGELPRVCNNSFDMTPVPFTHEAGCELGHVRTNFEFN